MSKKVLLAKPAKPELVNQLRKGDPEKVMEALKQVEPVKLRERSLRGANFFVALLPGADLRRAQLQGADLREAQLQGADLGEAQLQGANLEGANLRGANLGAAQLRGANFERAQLQNAYLRKAKLQGANLEGAALQGEDLGEAELQGANLRYAQLQGADLSGAKLQGVDLQSAELYGANVENSRTALVDLRAARWTPLNAERLGEIREVLGKTPYREVLERIERAAGPGLAPPLLKSCLIDPDAARALGYCEKTWMPGQIDAFRSELLPVLEGLACESSAVAGGLLRQILGNEYVIAGGLLRQTYTDETSGRWGLAARFVTLLDKRECEGLSSLPEGEKDWIRRLAKREEERRRQSGSGKPAEELRASPNPPPATAPETP